MLRNIYDVVREKEQAKARIDSELRTLEGAIVLCTEDNGHGTIPIPTELPAEKKTLGYQ